MRARRHLVLALVLLAAVAGCGDSAETSTAGSEPAADAAAPLSAETPRQAVLAWWDRVQANDPESARGFYLEPPALPDLAGQLNYLGSAIDGEMRVLSVGRKNGTTLVRATWTPPGGRPRRVTLRLRREAGDWKLLDARFLDAMVARLRQEE
jgi:hypothetical protein